jgi:uncharacterized delta-60 repeat protein
MKAHRLALSLAALLAAAAPAAANAEGGPLRQWTVSEFDRGRGEVQVASGSQLGGELSRTVDLGRVTFNLQPFDVFDRAAGGVFSTADGVHYGVSVQAPSIDFFRPGSAKGGLTHLDQYQAYRKKAGAALTVNIDHGQIQAADEHAQLDAAECPILAPCEPIRGFVRYRVRAYTAKGAFFDVGGLAFLQGYGRDWDHGAATSAGSQKPAWGRRQFLIDNDFDDSHTFRNPVVYMDRARTLKVPLASVPAGQLFAVHVSLDSEAINDRGRESGISAGIKDPQHVVRAHGLTPRGAPKFKEPRVKPLRPARCPGGRPRGAGVLQLRDSALSANESDGDSLVLVTRTGGTRGSASVTLRTRGGSARAGADFRQTSTTVRFGDRDASPRVVEIPLREDQTLESPEQLTVSLSQLRCARLGARRRVSVTIVDDDQPPPPPPPAFTVGGTVDGLHGSGLLLVNRGTVLRVTGNGRFTFPGTFPDGSPYDVRVQTQPVSPDQVCSVVDGAGTVRADVSDVAVHCTDVAAPTGLDTTFGSGGRVSTPGGGDARAVLIQPDGHIVTVGRRGDGVHFQFGATRHDAAGNLDHGFGDQGIATTDLGGSDDEASDAAPLADGGFVAVGRTDAAGLADIDFGVARYTADGKPVDDFDDDGFVTTDVSGHHGDVANAVAVQPDGKIVVAGFAKREGVNGDFALVRYNPDGSLDESFDKDGRVTTDLGTQDDDARAVAIDPDGRIVAAGDAGEDVALARYLPDGTLDPTFDADGVVVSDLGFNDVANGVALGPGGTILVAGTRLGPNLTLDPMIARYDANGERDLAFGGVGIADTDLSGGNDSGDDLVVDSGGGIVVVGSATSPTVSDMALVRYKPDGTLDKSLTSDFHGAGDFGHALAIDPLGRIVAAGSTANGGDNEFALMRAVL